MIASPRVMALIALLALPCAGCVQQDHDLVLRADGSGRLSSRIQLTAQAATFCRQLTQAEGRLGAWSRALFPDAAAQAGLQQRPGMTVQRDQARDLADGGRLVELQVAFDDVRSLAGTRAAALFGFQLTATDRATVLVPALAGAEALRTALDRTLRNDAHAEDDVWPAVHAAFPYRIKATLPGGVEQWTNAAHGRLDARNWPRMTFQPGVLALRLPLRVGPVAPAPDPPSDLSLELTSATLTRRLRWDKGETVGESATLELHLTLRCPDGAGIVSLDALHIDASAAGVPLRADLQSLRLPAALPLTERARPLSLRVLLPDVPASTGHLSLRVRGTARYGTGRTRIDVGRVDHPAVPDDGPLPRLRLRVDRRGRGFIVWIGRAAGQRLAGLTLIGEDDRPLRATVYTRTPPPERDAIPVSVIPQEEIPADARLVLELYETVATEAFALDVPTLSLEAGP